MESTWESRDLPVLEAIVQLLDETGDSVEGEQIVKRTGFDSQTVALAVKALQGEDPPFFDARVIRRAAFRPLEVVSVSNLTGHARRTVGAWPTPENVIARLAAALEEVAATENDPVRRSKLKDAAAVVGGITGQAAAGFMSGYLLHNVGMS